jgi:catechol 2,3-dioxygenase-like lactoylglutathione lyase family enzyme
MNEAGCATPRVLQLGFTTADAERCAGFYRRYLGFGEPQEFVLDAGAHGRLLGLPQGRFKLLRLPLGSEWLEITQVLEAGPAQRAGDLPPADSRSCDLWFQHLCLVTRDLDAALRRLQPALESGLAQAVSRAPQTLPAWNTAAAGIRAFKFRDPEGHNLELLQFPAGKGEARWHQGTPLPGTSLLGIDHSAISIAETSRSCRFYDALLGLRLGSDGINSGPTQDDLDGLQQTRVRITGHRCPQGPGIECLDYQDPNRGRAMPADLGVQDLFHWQIRLQIEDLSALVDQIEPLGGRVLGPGPVELGDQGPLLGGRLALQVADPDGHRLQLVQP